MICKQKLASNIHLHEGKKNIDHQVNSQGYIIIQDITNKDRTLPTTHIQPEKASCNGGSDESIEFINNDGVVNVPKTSQE